jgi:hypothetical protein
MIRLIYIAAVVLLLSGISSPLLAEKIPYFPRQYNDTCSTCNVTPPKLNASGEDFRLDVYRMSDREKQPTIPMAVWVSGRGERIADPEVEKIKSFINRVEIISGGTFAAERFSYFVEWRTFSFERTGDGSLLDRSGRFEDIFLVADLGKFDVTAGQFRQIDQVDVSTRPGLSEPIALSASLPEYGEGSARIRSLRRFAPSARSPAVRFTRTRPLDEAWNWTISLSVPFPGEFSIPITRRARINASNEFEINPKGIVVESFVRSGLHSYGGHLFYRNSDHFLANAVVTGSLRSIYWTAIAGLDKTPEQMHSRWSVEALYAPGQFAAFGARLEERTSDGLSPAAIPYVNIHFPGTKYTLRLTLEHRFQKDRQGTFIEIATIF